MNVSKINVQGVDISIAIINQEDYISLTDMIKAKDGDFFVTDWLRNRNTLEYIGTWEQMYNPNFNYGEFAIIKSKAGLNNFKISIKELIEKTNAISIHAKAGRYGGTYAHKDIAFNFGMWISPVFQLLVIKEFQRLKEDESNRLNLDWKEKRFLAKAAYRLQTDAIKEYMLPLLNLPKDKERFVYATEADMINIAVFGMTAKEWEEQNTEKFLKGENMRDSASATQLVAVVAAESLNKELIKNGISPSIRLKILRESAMENIRSLSESPAVKKRLVGNTDNKIEGIEKV